MDHPNPAPISILLVEDNPGDVELLSVALKDAKIRNEICHVDDGEKAIETIQRLLLKGDEFLPDLIILDLNLPKINGREVLRFIKEDATMKKIPVVILTSSQAEEDVAKSYEYHANCYIIKPIDLDDFLKVVNTIEEFWLSIVKLPKGNG